MSQRWRTRLNICSGAALSFGIACVYFAGAQRAIGTGDIAEMVVASYTLGIPHPTGYPIYTWLGRLFLQLPAGGIPFRLSLMSAVFASLTLFLLYQIVASEVAAVTRSRLLKYVCAILAVIILGFFRPFRHFAQVSEVYSLNACLVGLFMFLLARWSRTNKSNYFHLSALVLGLALGTHMTNLFLVPLLVGLGFLRGRGLKAVYAPLILVAVGASQYLYLLVRAHQNPAYLHPLARFFERLTWTGSSNPLHNWFWFITGARWRGHYARSFGEVSFKARDLLNTLISDYTILGVITLVLGVALLLRRRRVKRTTVVFIWIVLLDIGYYLLYQPSGSGMILPLFFCLSLFSALGVAAVSGLAAKMIGGRSLYHVVPYVSALAAAAALAYGILAKPAIDYSEQKSPATLVSQMIDRIPDGSVVEGVQWKYEKIIDYYRIVEKRDVRFRQGACDDRAIAEGKCFLLGTETKDQYLRRGYPLGLYLYVEGALPVYQVRMPEPSEQ